MLDAGHKIIYEPYAAVYHHHGINHGGDRSRADRVVRVIELIQKGRTEDVNREALSVKR